MKQTLMVKLFPSLEQHEALLQTMECFNKACNTISEVAHYLHRYSKFTLQKLVYQDIRSEYGLSSQMTIRAIAKVSESYKIEKKSQHEFKPHSAIVYDQRLFSWKGSDAVSLLTTKGRQTIPIRVGDYQRVRMDYKVKQTDLVLRHSDFYLALVIDVPIPVVDVAIESLGVDFGVNNLAVDSDGQFYSGKEVDNVRERTDTLKAALQGAGTKSAKRHLKKISGRESRFRCSVNHTISKQLVSKAKDTQRCIALEDLSGVGETTVRHSQRRRHKSWAFFQLRNFIEYKAKAVGVMVRFVNPKYTSQECPHCHHIAKSNRKSQAIFVCQQCGYSLHADVVGAINISRRASVNVPIVSLSSLWSWVGTISSALAVSG